MSTQSLSMFETMTGKQAFDYVTGIAKVKRVSLNKLCQQAEVSYATVWRWKNGMFKPKIESMLRFSRL
jgi:hypothetical protein